MKKVLALAIAIVLLISVAYGIDTPYNKDNYALDIVELGIADAVPAMGNWFANILFSLVVIVVDLTITIFSVCVSFPFSDLFGSAFDGILSPLHSGIFQNMIMFATLFLGVLLAWLFMKRNMIGIGQEILKFMAIVIGASLLISETPTVIKTIDELTQSLNHTVVNAVLFKDENSNGNYAENMGQILWQTMVHDPWVQLEFLGAENLEIDQDTAIDKILDAKPNSDKRQSVINGMAGTDKKNPKAFGKDLPGQQASMLIIYLVPCLLRCLVYMAFGGLQLALRLLTIILFYFGIIIMTLALFPQLGGTLIISGWLKKIAQLQINIIILSFVMSAIMLLDQAVAASNIAKPFGKMGWLVVVAIQTIITVAVFVYRDKILDLLKFTNKLVDKPLAARRDAQVAMSNMDSAVYAGAGAIGDWAQDNASTKIEHLKESVSSAGYRLADASFGVQEKLSGYFNSDDGSNEPIQRPRTTDYIRNTTLGQSESIEQEQLFKPIKRPRLSSIEEKEALEIARQNAPRALVDDDLQTVNISNLENDSNLDHEPMDIKRPVSAASYLREQSLLTGEQENPLLFSEISDQELLNMCDRVIAENSGSTQRPVLDHDFYADTSNYEHGKVNTIGGESKIELNELNQNATTPKEIGLETPTYIGSEMTGETPVTSQIGQNKSILEHATDNQIPTINNADTVQGKTISNETPIGLSIGDNMSRRNTPQTPTGNLRQRTHSAPKPTIDYQQQDEQKSVEQDEHVTATPLQISNFQIKGQETKVNVNRPFIQKK